MKKNIARSILIPYIISVCFPISPSFAGSFDLTLHAGDTSTDGVNWNSSVLSIKPGSYVRMTSKVTNNTAVTATTPQLNFSNAALDTNYTKMGEPPQRQVNSIQVPDIPSVRPDQDSILLCKIGGFSHRISRSGLSDRRINTLSRSEVPIQSQPLFQRYFSPPVESPIPLQRPLQSMSMSNRISNP